MKIAIIGAGTIGTIYGALFRKYEHDVKFYVGASSINKYNAPLTCKIIDEHHVFPSSFSYTRNIFSNVQELDHFDLIIVCVRHYQIDDIVELLKHTSKPNILFFCNNWGTLEKISSTLSPERVFFGMPRAGGCISDQHLLEVGLLKQVILGNTNHPFFTSICELFEQAQIVVTKIDKMQDWYWTHLATTIAWSTVAAKTKGFLTFSRSFSALRQAMLVGRQALNIAKARGADINCCRDADVFKLPTIIGAFLLLKVMKSPIIQAISSGHGYAVEDLQKAYYDVLAEGEKQHVDVTLLKSYAQYIEQMSH